MFANIVMVWAGALISLGGTSGSASTHLPKIAMRPADSMDLVTKDVAVGRPPFRFPASADSSTASEKIRTFEWMHAGNWRMTAGYASTKSTQILGRLDQVFGNKRSDVRSAKGLRLAAELLSGGDLNSRETLALDARLQHVRIQDSSLTDAGEKLGDARLALVFKHSW